MDIFGKHWDPLELIFASTAFLLAIVPILLQQFAGIITKGLLLADVSVLVYLIIARNLRITYVMPRVQPVMNELSKYAESASTSVWTTRSHVGEAENEQGYFNVIGGLVLKNELCDVRRIIRLNSALSTRIHLHWLIDKFADQPAVKVRYVETAGQLFDFAIFDGKVGALGFPQTEAEGFMGAIFTRESTAVRGLEEAFNILWAQGTTLFNGTAAVNDVQRQKIKDEIDRKLDALAI